MIIDIRFTSGRAPIQLQHVMRTTIRQNAPGDTELIVVFEPHVNKSVRFSISEIEAFSIYND